jgi:hypothetical protein
MVEPLLEPRRNKSRAMNHLDFFAVAADLNGDGGQPLKPGVEQECPSDRSRSRKEEKGKCGPKQLAPMH